MPSNSEGPGQGLHDGSLHRRGSGAGLKHNLASDTNDEPSFPRRFSRRRSHFEDVLEDPTESQGSDGETNQGANILVLRPKNNSKEVNHTTFPEAAEISIPDAEQRNAQAATPEDNLSDERRSPFAEKIPRDLASAAMVELVVDPIRRDMVDRIMATVMVMLDLETDASDGSESSSPSDEPSMSGCESDYEFLSLEEEDAEDEPTDDGHQTTQAGTSTGNRTVSLPTNQSGDSNVGKRAIGDRSSFDDDDRGGAKRQRPATSRAGSEDFSKKFACPYFKRSFPDEEHLTQHSRAEPICQNLQEPPDMEGITQQQLRELKSRKKPKGEDNSEEGKWRRIYRILFPEAIEIPRSQTCSRYHEYSRSRLPNLLRQEIEREACQGTQVIEEQIRGRLREIVERCMEAVFSEFRHHRLADDAAQPSDDDDGSTGAALQTSAATESLAEMYSVPPPTRSPPDVPGFDACLAAQPGWPLDETYSEAGWTGHAVPAGLEVFLDGRAFQDGFDPAQSTTNSEAADLSNDGATLVEVSMQSEVPGVDAGLSKKVEDDTDYFLSDPALDLPPSA
ncbi:hypothetical protein SLS56_012019 [Neofusicoccum ribis]|uniref:C2H2-type domain-containing protein n=1 Tax=Neofusicoccum ribis TaxID=45134 RepID=A0ABR3SA03_9PEZI